MESTWEVRPLARWFDSAFSGTWGSDPGTDVKDLGCVRGTDFDFERLVTKGTMPIRSVSQLDLDRRVLQTDDLVIEKSGGGEHQYVGRVVRYVGTDPAVPTNFAAGLRCRADVSARFATYSMRALYERGINRRWVNQTTGIQNLDLDGYLTERVPLPPTKQQRRIADFLDDETARIDALIAAKWQMAQANATRVLAAASWEILQGTDPTRVDGHHPTTSRRRLGSLIRLHRGHDLPIESRVEGAVPVISSGGISGWHNTPAAIAPGVVTGRYGTLGEVFYSAVDYWPLNTALYVSDFKGSQPRWVFWLLKVLPLAFDGEKSAVGGINRNVIANLLVPAPETAKQAAVAAKLDELAAHAEALTDTLTRQIELLRERRQALITAAVTGELEI